MAATVASVSALVLPFKQQSETFEAGIYGSNGGPRYGGDGAGGNSYLDVQTIGTLIGGNSGHGGIGVSPGSSSNSLTGTVGLIQIVEVLK